MPSRVPLHRSSVVPPLVLGLLPFVLFPRIALIERVFSVHDVQAYFFPYHVLPAKMVARGELPLWNPYVFAGIPLLGDGQTAMFYPPNWLFFMLPGPAALNYALLLQFSIAGIGMYWFARVLGLSRLPSFISALSYMCCGFLAARVVHLSIMSGAAMIPVILACLDRMLAAGHSPAAGGTMTARWLGLTALALACQVFAGHPQMPVYTAIAAVLYTVVRTAEASFYSAPRRLIVRAALLLAGAYVIGYALAAIQLAPWAEVARLSVRAAGADYMFIFRTSTTRAEWLLFFFPFLFGGDANLFETGPMNIAQRARAWEHSGYVGILPLALALVALWHFVELRRQARPDATSLPSEPLRSRWYSLLFLLVLLAAGLTLAAGRHTPARWFVYRTPILGSLRAVERGLVLASFSLTLLAGFGLQRIVERPQRRPWLLPPAVLIVLVPLFFVWLARQLGSAPNDLENLSLDLPNAYVPVLLALASALLLAWWSWRPGGTLSRVVAVALVLCDLGLYATSLNPTVSRQVFEYRPDVLDAMRDDREPFRKATMVIETNDLESRTAQEMLAMSWGMVYGVEDVNGFNSLQPRRYTDYLFGRRAHDVSYGFLRDPWLLRSDSPILSSLNVRYVLVSPNDRLDLPPDLRPIFENHYVRVFENTRVYPRAYFAERVRGETDARAVLGQVTAAGFDGRRDALVETTDPPRLPPATTPGTTRTFRISPTDLRVTTAAAEARFLVLSEMYFPGWRAYVDGVETMVYRTNYLFRGVVVPPGRHVVRFVYRPWAVLAGAVLSVMSLVAVVALLLAPRFGWPGRR
jgi:Bacterial membrane protein YfhO